MIEQFGYKISPSFYQFINQQVLPGLNISSEQFWKDLAAILGEFIPQNQALLKTRESLQSQIDAWHLAHKNIAFDPNAYEMFLREIGYLLEQPADFSITTQQVDPEVAKIAGPQLVVPLMNARFALNAANARWGSLYDALYSSDVIQKDQKTDQAGYDPTRGALVQAYAKDFLDQAIPLEDKVSHKEVVSYSIANNQLVITLLSGDEVKLRDPNQWRGYQGKVDSPSAFLFVHHGLHLDIQIDPNSAVGKSDPASVTDIILESALTTIQDCEDSIAAVDAEDKIQVYQNWLGLMKGDLSATFNKGGQTVSRHLNANREYRDATHNCFNLSGRSLQFIRNVGLLMTSDLVLTQDNQEVPEGILDALVTALIALHNIKGNDQFKNSRYASIYIVKPKMHGPFEVAFSDQLFARVEACLGLAKNTIKMGIMDEERRTSVNLKACIFAAKDRVAFINTGFLDRTGDEIHTSMQAGAMVRKEVMKNEKWITAYEDRNVRIGLECGFKNRAQIGKGMWAIPDQMAAMMQEKVAHLKAGANCAWVPSPTAATLHALHYHQLNVAQIQEQLLNHYSNQNSRDDLSDLLTIPLLMNKQDLNLQTIQNELDNNVQGLLGYVVRWIDQGIGCSSVPDINNIGRMEDRATLRISSQHICNWLLHGLLDQAMVLDSLKKMARVVDQQNVNVPHYTPMATDFEHSLAFQAAKDLIFKGQEQPSGYTEPLLHQRRKQQKQLNNAI
ncbi:MAG: malate synthase G [Enterobacterales bacterium]|nr:malate synthase G [Enterobacterales bacterium]